MPHAGLPQTPGEHERVGGYEFGMDLPDPVDEATALAHVLLSCDRRAGDDAAVLLVGGGSTCVSVDSTIEGVHAPATTSVEVLGRRATARAASDLAAMGAAPLAMTCAVHVPTGRWADAVDAVRGVAARGRDQGLPLVGGDLSSTPAAALALVVTVLGRRGSARAGGYVSRSCAHAGDVVVVTGAIGAAGRALALGSDELPEPPDRLRAGMALARCASAMTDVTDGLVADVGHLASASGVAIRLDLDRVPVAPGVDDPVSACTSGDDYELVACLPPARLDAARRLLAAADPGASLTVVGSVAGGPAAVSCTLRGRPVDRPGGFVHD